MSAEFVPIMLLQIKGQSLIRVQIQMNLILRLSQELSMNKGKGKKKKQWMKCSSILKMNLMSLDYRPRRLVSLQCYVF